MNRKLLKKVIKNRKLFVPLVFTEKQMNVLVKYYDNNRLTNSEKKALYTSITKKIKAIESIEKKDNEFYINNPNLILKERLRKAKEILNNYPNERVFIGGSFLFSKKYNDIDIFIIRKKGYKEIYDKDKHIIYLSEKRLQNPIIQSASLISVSNFEIPNKIIKKKPKLSEIMGLYHEAVIELLTKEKKPESMRDLIFNYNLFCKNKIMNGKELREYSVDAEKFDKIIKEILLTLFTQSYLYVELHEYIKTLKKSIKNIKPNEHLKRFRDTYEEMIYGT